MDKIIMIAKLIPVIIEIMKAIEDAIPGQGSGEKKLAAVRGILEVTSENVSQYWPSIEKVVKVLVEVFNSSGVFKK